MELDTALDMVKWILNSKNKPKAIAGEVCTVINRMILSYMIIMLLIGLAAGFLICYYGYNY